MPDEREQWALRDVAPVVLEHFGLGDGAGAGAAGDCAAVPRFARGARSLCWCRFAAGLTQPWPLREALRRVPPRPCSRCSPSSPRHRCCSAARCAGARRGGAGDRRDRRSGSPTATRRSSRSDAKHRDLSTSARWSTATGRSATSPATRRSRWSSSTRRPAGARVVDRLPGRLEDGARLLGRLRPQAQRPLRLPAALRALPGRAGRLAAPLAGRHPRPARPARLRRLPLLLQPGRDRRLGAAQYPLLLYLLGRALWIGCAVAARASGRSGRRPGC